LFVPSAGAGPPETMIIVAPTTSAKVPVALSYCHLKAMPIEEFVVSVM
jgi:hypothetical protein